MEKNSTIGHIEEFEPQNKPILVYLERESLFFEGNKQVTWLLNLMGEKTYSFDCNLVAPTQPKDKPFNQIVAALKRTSLSIRLLLLLRNTLS